MSYHHPGGLRAQLRLWWALARPFTLTAAVIPVFVGTAVAAVDGDVRWLPFLAMLVASALIQVGTNMFNEYFDYRRGIDHVSSVGIAGAIVTGAMAQGLVLAGALAAFAVALGLRAQPAWRSWQDIVAGTFPWIRLHSRDLITCWWIRTWVWWLITTTCEAGRLAQSSSIRWSTGWNNYPSEP